MQNTTDNKLSAIDKALAAAKARKAARQASESPAADATVKEPVAKKETQPDFAKAQKDRANKELTELQRAAAKAKRDADREARRGVVTFGCEGQEAALQAEKLLNGLVSRAWVVAAGVDIR